VAAWKVKFVNVFLIMQLIVWRVKTTFYLISLMCSVFWLITHIILSVSCDWVQHHLLHCPDSRYR